MIELEYKFTNNILFKMLFVKHPGLLKKLVATLLKIKLDSITAFEITNPEIPPEFYGDKFCRLDINMLVDGQRVDLEVQVNNEGDYPERSRYCNRKPPAVPGVPKSFSYAKMYVVRGTSDKYLLQHTQPACLRHIRAFADGGNALKLNTPRAGRQLNRWRSTLF